MISIAAPQIGPEEKRAVLEVMDSGILAQGPQVAAFENAFAESCGVQFAVATSSGTTALHTALLAHNIGAGDEVITTPFTFIATANSVLYTGAHPVFVDIDPRTFNINPEKIEAAINPRTRAIIPVHLFGLCCDMAPLLEIANRHDLMIIEDACQSHGASYEGRFTGSFGSGVFSLYPTKNMTSGEGGMITTNDQGFASRCRSIRQHGMRAPYLHEEIGFNFRMSDVHAAIGREQLKKLARFNQSRQENARFYNQNLGGVGTPYIPENSGHVFHQYTIRVPADQRDDLQDFLEQRGIGSAVYYPIPIHRQPLYKEKLGYNQVLPVAERAADEVLSLPVHPSLSMDDLKLIVDSVNKFFTNFTGASNTGESGA